MAILLQITSGRGPTECAWVVARLSAILLKEAYRLGLLAEVIEQEPGPLANTSLSVLIHLDGVGSNEFARRCEGVIQWIGISPFRPHYQRKNWFVGVRSIAIPEPITFAASDVRFETFRSSGPGGQHVNTTDSAVRAVHLPTGISANASEERSQTANRKRALERLSILIARRKEKQALSVRQERWSAHNELERGNPVRVYVGQEFRLRTGDKRD
ncbi:peptide chain release factor H [Geobacter pickeringii]|uniref:Prokaryotic-type class I peptide chain release factors domain-containing protein n=1 Tax=Geobacter pickeringii TaxID=345632 RepID=A0A0B5BA27_9BACT|nr:peptide chain release factor H [Geobacter pickeringii]AJE03573.1 hypothetical protein GPICK_09595 [Geobacter pickeringii]